MEYIRATAVPAAAAHRGYARPGAEELASTFHPCNAAWSVGIDEALRASRDKILRT